MDRLKHKRGKKPEEKHRCGNQNFWFSKNCCTPNWDKVTCPKCLKWRKNG